MLAVRLTESLEQELNIFTKISNQTKTDVVKEALKLFFETQKKRQKKSAFELGKDFFGTYESGQSDLSTTYKKRLKEKLNAKYSTD
jgi:hypothetical protein